MTLVLLFFIISPLVVLYTAGYRYDFITHSIEQTGVISIDIEPRDATVHLNDVLIDKKLPIRLANRAPGTYRVKISRNGYHTWEQDIRVESKKTTYIRDVALFAQHDFARILPTEIEKNIISSYTAPQGDVAILLTKKEDIEELFIVNLNTEIITPLIRTDSLKNLDVLWSPYGNTVAISFLDGQERQLHLFATNDPSNVTSYMQLSATSTFSYAWSPNTFFPALYVPNEQGVILEYSLRTRSTYALLPDAQAPWSVDTKAHVWYFNSSTKKFVNTKLEEEVILPTEISTITIQNILRIDTSKIILQIPEGIVVIKRNQNLQNTYQHINAQQYFFDTNTDRWYIWSPQEVWLAHADGAVTLVTRTGKEIQSIRPLDISATILLITKDGYETFNPGYFVSQSLQNFSDFTIIDSGVSLTNQKIYGLFKNQNGKVEYRVLEY